MLKRFEILECVSIAKSIEEIISLYVNIEEKFTNSNEYQSIVGSLIYFTYTCLVILHFISCLSKFIVVLQHSHLEATKRVFSYIKVIINHSIFISNQCNDILIGYIDLYFKRIWIKKNHKMNDFQNKKCCHSLKQKPSTNSSLLHNRGIILNIIRWSLKSRF